MLLLNLLLQCPISRLWDWWFQNVSINASNVENSLSPPRPHVSSIRGFQSLPSVWLNPETCPGWAAGGACVALSVGLFLAASPSLLWAFQTIEAQTGLNCCIFSECPFVTVQWPIFFFFSTTELMEKGCQVTGGNGSGKEAVGSGLGTCYPGWYSGFMGFLHFIDSILSLVQF